MDHATSASPRTIPRIAKGRNRAPPSTTGLRPGGLSLCRLESSCAIAGESAVASDKEEESRERDGDEEDKAKEQEERDRGRVRAPELPCREQDRGVERSDVARTGRDQRNEVGHDHDEHGTSERDAEPDGVGDQEIG